MVPSSFFRVDNGHFDISDGCSLVPDQLLNYEVGGQWTVDTGHWTLFLLLLSPLYWERWRAGLWLLVQCPN